MESAKERANVRCYEINRSSFHELASFKHNQEDSRPTREVHVAFTQRPSQDSLSESDSDGCKEQGMGSVTLKRSKVLLKKFIRNPCVLSRSHLASISLFGLFIGLLSSTLHLSLEVETALWVYYSLCTIAVILVHEPKQRVLRSMLVVHILARIWSADVKLVALLAFDEGIAGPAWMEHYRTTSLEHWFSVTWSSEVLVGLIFGLASALIAHGMLLLLRVKSLAGLRKAILDLVKSVKDGSIAMTATSAFYSALSILLSSEHDKGPQQGTHRRHSWTQSVLLHINTIISVHQEDRLEFVFYDKEHDPTGLHPSDNHYEDSDSQNEE